MNMDTVATLALLGKMVDSSVTVNTASGQSMGVAGDVYHYDIIIFSKNEKEHIKHTEIIFQKLKAAGLKLKESKCDFFKREIYYLGHLISDEGIHPLPEKLDTKCNMPKPRNPKEIRQFLCLCGY